MLPKYQLLNSELKRVWFRFAATSATTVFISELAFAMRILFLGHRKGGIVFIADWYSSESLYFKLGRMKPWASQRTKPHSQVRIFFRYHFESKWRGWDFDHTNRRCYMAPRRHEIYLREKKFRISRWPYYFLLILWYITTFIAIFRRFSTNFAKTESLKGCPKAGWTFPNI